MSKRKRTLITSLALSLGFAAMQFLPDQYRFLFIFSLALFTCGLFYWSLREGLSVNMTLLTLSLPFLFTVGVGLFWFLLPVTLLARVPVIIFYGLGIYALCLTTNIYTVSAIRTIALLRTARGVGFVLTLVTFFLVFDTILSLRTQVYYTSIGVFLVSLLLFWQGLWSMVLDKKFSRKEFLMSLVLSFIMGEIAVSLFFWPVGVVVGSLFLTLAAYILLGLGQAETEGTLFQQTLREYLILGFFVFLGMLIATSWRG